MSAVALMEANEDFYAYKSGVYRSALSNDQSLTARQHKKRLHSVKILGYVIDTRDLIGVYTYTHLYTPIDTDGGVQVMYRTVAGNVVVPF